MPPRYPDLRERTLQLAVRIIRLSDSLPRTRSASVIAAQIVRSGTSVGAQYRESIRARSDAEVVSKFESVLQELDETDYWLALTVAAEMMSNEKLESLRKEVDELTAIVVTCVKKVKLRKR